MAVVGEVNRAGSSPRTRKIGRPPRVKAEDTRRRIIELARGIFAERGFEIATNKEIADAAEMTPAALYYHFVSKSDLYLAVYDDTQQRIYQAFADATEGVDTFVGKLDAVLAATHEMNRAEPTLARFTAAVRVDMRRHPEMFEGFKPGNTLREDFFADLVGAGVRTGEIAAADAEVVQHFLLATLIGLNDAMSDDLAVHQSTILGIRRIIRGKLVNTA
jgi:AcrR family transcriptional regulator